MASSEALAIERLGSADVAAGLALSDAAGWNQTGADWAVFVDHGEVFGVRDGAGRLVATAAALPYDGALGWVSMVLVDVGHRHRGLATALLDAAVAALQRAGRTAVLDATPAGAAVYRQSGFRSGFAFERWEGDAPADAHDATGLARSRDSAVAPGGGSAATGAVRAAGDDDIEAIVALDRAAFGIGRAWLLRSFLARPASRAWCAGASGFVVARAGRRATQIGPLVAASEGEAIDLVGAALAASSGRVFIDVPARCAGLARCLAGHGFARQRPFVRMALAATPALTAKSDVFAVAGPEFG